MNELIVIDDEEDNRVFFEHYFTQEIQSKEMKFEYFMNCRDGRDYIRANPDADLQRIVITDLNLPDCSGLDLIDEILDLSVDNHTKIIVISAYDNAYYKQRALDKKIVEYFVKPVDFEQLKSCVLALFDGK